MKERRQRKARSFKQIKNAINHHKETNCCGVVAVTVATGVSFGKALAVCTRLGRPARKGTDIEIIKKACAELGHPLRAIEAKGTLKTFAANNPEGTFLCLNSGGKHITAVRDGKIVDWVDQDSKKRLKQGFIFEVITAEAAPAE